MRCTIFLLGFFLVSFNLHSKSQHLVTATSDVDPVVTDLFLISNDQGETEKLKMTFSDGESARFSSPKNLSEGTVLKQVSGRDVVVLKSEEFDTLKGGYVDMVYLANGITGNRKSLELRIIQDSEGWKIFYDGIQIKRFHFLGKKFLGKVVGIDKVQVLDQ